MAELISSRHTVSQHYSVCVIDIGSPKLGNLGWYLWDAHQQVHSAGDDLDALFPPLLEAGAHTGVLLGLEAPLFVPIRQDPLLMTKARAGESPRPWSAGAGAQVLALNLPIMTYLFQQLQSAAVDWRYCIDHKEFYANSGDLLLFEALVSGSNKGQSHIEDAQIMTNYCLSYALNKQLPPSILQDEENTTYFNLAAAALLRVGAHSMAEYLDCPSPIYRPDYRP